MALVQSELWRIKRELGYPLTTIGALPYVEYIALFEQVILPFLQTGADTLCSTEVAEEDVANGPVQTRLTLDDVTGFHVWDKVFLDVDDSQEIVTIQSMSAGSITALVKKPHGSNGKYPVIVDGGVAQVRSILKRIDSLHGQIAGMPETAGIKRVEEIEFFGSRTGGSSQFKDALQQREDARRELSEAIGVPYLRKMRSGSASSRVEVY